VNKSLIEAFFFNVDIKFSCKSPNAHLKFSSLSGYYDFELINIYKSLFLETSNTINDDPNSFLISNLKNLETPSKYKSL
jgi:hypothetical protein